MQTVTGGWNEGDARKAANRFVAGGVYMEPPDSQLYVGRGILLEFFGGAKGTDSPMQMTWHPFAVDPSDEVGFGEYTFALNNRYHSVVIVKLVKFHGLSAAKKVSARGPLKR